MALKSSLFAIGRAVLKFLPAPLAERARAAKRDVLNRRATADVFTEIFEGNTWDGTESVSGPGSTLAATKNFREALPALMERTQTKTLLDIPCGDVFWIHNSLPAGVSYIGGDIVPALVERNRDQYPNVGQFIVADLVKDDLPKADTVLVRDCFIHLPLAMIQEAIENVRRSGARYILTTTFPNLEENIDIEIGGFRPVNMQAAPFNWPEPEFILADMAEGENNDKHLGLWRLD